MSDHSPLASPSRANQNAENSVKTERTTLEPVSHELGGQYGFTPSNITELGTDMTPTSMSQLSPMQATSPTTLLSHQTPMPPAPRPFGEVTTKYETSDSARSTPGSTSKR